jgi:hypothetical protein
LLEQHHQQQQQQQQQQQEEVEVLIDHEVQFQHHYAKLLQHLDVQWQQ